LPVNLRFNVILSNQTPCHQIIRLYFHSWQYCIYWFLWNIIFLFIFYLKINRFFVYLCDETWNWIYKTRVYYLKIFYFHFIMATLLICFYISLTIQRNISKWNKGKKNKRLGLRFLLFNDTFNNISVISSNKRLNVVLPQKYCHDK
jgi:hypothetical protein